MREREGWGGWGGVSLEPRDFSQSLVLNSGTCQALITRSCSQSNLRSLNSSCNMSRKYYLYHITRNIEGDGETIAQHIYETPVLSSSKTGLKKMLILAGKVKKTKTFILKSSTYFFPNLPALHSFNSILILHNNSTQHLLSIHQVICWAWQIQRWRHSQLSKSWVTVQMKRCGFHCNPPGLC